MSDDVVMPGPSRDLPTFDVTPFLNQDEGQHFDRKSTFEGPPASKRVRRRKVVRDEVAEYVAAFANAEGGVLILGIEDDGEITGHRFPDKAVDAILQAPAKRLQPPQSSGFTVDHDGVVLLVFDVVAADVPVQVVGDGFPLRIGDQTVQASESQIKQLKFQGMVESYESQASPTRLSDLDAELLHRARSGGGLQSISDEDYLLRRKMAVRRGRDVVLRRAAELVFSAHGPDHPNAGVRLFRVVGTERRVGAQHNVEERPRIEGNLYAVTTEAMAVIGSLLRRPSRLVGTRFRPAPEYPDFSWKEALLNAVAHRNYGTEGRTTEVWLFDDRMEVVSPGGLVPGISLEDLTSLRRVHSSRNPRVVRALVDLGFMRDQGEGIPRMFAEMEISFLPRPELLTDGARFVVTLRNTPTLTARDTAFVASLGDDELTREEFRALFEAHRHGQVDNARMRKVIGTDTLGASQLLRRLRDRGYLVLHSAGSASFYTLAESDGRQLTLNGEATDRGEPDMDRGELDADKRELDADRRELAARIDGELLETIRNLGPRPRKEKLRPLVLRLLDGQWWSVRDLAAALGRKDLRRLVDSHLTPMFDEGLLERRYPHSPTDPRQAYRTRA